MGNEVYNQNYIRNMEKQSDKKSLKLSILFLYTGIQNMILVGLAIQRFTQYCLHYGKVIFFANACT